MENKVATIESQIDNEICNVEDTEEIFWLKQSDDYQSKVKAGDLLVRQYRFKDAIAEYQKASLIKQNDGMLFIKIGGAYLTLFCFSEAENYYKKALQCGIKEEKIAFYLGIMKFFQKEFSDAIFYFEKAEIPDGETLISIIYWHTVASFRLGKKSPFLEKYQEDMEVGHHIAYKRAIAVFNGQEQYDKVPIPESSLDAIVILYGISEYLTYVGNRKAGNLYAEKLLEYKEVWPCIAYLACYYHGITG